MDKVKEVIVYSILADEMADISGIEQLSTGKRYFDAKCYRVQELFRNKQK